jgi:hypothetical protein
VIGDFPPQTFHVVARHALAIAGLRGGDIHGGKLGQQSIHLFGKGIDLGAQALGPGLVLQGSVLLGHQLGRRFFDARLILAGRRAQAFDGVRQLNPAGFHLDAFARQAIGVFAMGPKFELVPAHGRDGFIERGHGFGQGLLVAHVAIERGLVVQVEPGHHFFEFAHLALLRKHAGHRRLARATGHHAVGIDDLAVEGHQRLLGLGLPPQFQRLAQILDDDHVT